MHSTGPGIFSPLIPIEDFLRDLDLSLCVVNTGHFVRFQTAEQFDVHFLYFVVGKPACILVSESVRAVLIVDLYFCCHDISHLSPVTAGNPLSRY